MSNPIEHKTILLGVTGSIAAYKAAELASRLTQAGALVEVILTQAALQFITPLTFQSVTTRKAYTDADLWGGEGHVKHIGLGTTGDLYVIAPASANSLAKLAHGIADNLLSVTALAARCPILVAPAMDGGMYSHPATQANLEILRQRGLHVLGPASGRMASGLVGLGRMVEPGEILAETRQLLAQAGPFSGCRVVVTAGGTQEAIDPVRCITNHSSGKQGFALAQAALDLGACVTLISGPTAQDLATPRGAERIGVVSTQDMLDAVLHASVGADVLLMAAAPADFTPTRRESQKIKKNSGFTDISLAPAPDILATLADQPAGDRPRLVVGFAAETQNLLANAAQKMAAKHLDIIAANNVLAPDAGFGVDTNRVTLLYSDGQVEPLPLSSKAEVAETILERVLQRISPITDKPG